MTELRLNNNFYFTFDFYYSTYDSKKYPYNVRFSLYRTDEDGYAEFLDKDHRVFKKVDDKMFPEIVKRMAKMADKYHGLEGQEDYRIEFENIESILESQYGRDRK